jgi:hypothetical protein
VARINRTLIAIVTIIIAGTLLQIGRHLVFRKAIATALARSFSVETTRDIVCNGIFRFRASGINAITIRLRVTIREYFLAAQRATVAWRRHAFLIIANVLCARVAIIAFGIIRAEQGRNGAFLSALAFL